MQQAWRGGIVASSPLQNECYCRFAGIAWLLRFAVARVSVFRELRHPRMTGLSGTQAMRQQSHSGLPAGPTTVLRRTPTERRCVGLPRAEDFGLGAHVDGTDAW